MVKVYTHKHDTQEETDVSFWLLSTDSRALTRNYLLFQVPQLTSWQVQLSKLLVEAAFWAPLAQALLVSEGPLFWDPL